jgi:methionyl-tRNA formyltransferase
MKLKLIFFGTSSFAATVLKTLAENPDFLVVAVVTATDKPVGRKQEMQASFVALEAEKHKIPMLKPERLKDPEFAEKLKAYNADIFLVAAYGKIIPKNILDLPTRGSINIHGSLLPEYRGASPIHAVIIDGQKKTGITIMRMDELMDHGDMLFKHELPISPEQTQTELEKALALLAASHIAEDLKLVASGEAHPEPQDHSKAIFTKIINKEDGRIDWSKSAADIYNLFRAYAAWPGVYTFFNGQRLKIIECRIAEFGENVSGEKIAVDEKKAEKIIAGEVFKKDGHLLVGCGADSSERSFLEILSLQLEGKNISNAVDFARGHKDFIGARLE